MALLLYISLARISKMWSFTNIDTIHTLLLDYISNGQQLKQKVRWLAFLHNPKKYQEKIHSQLPPEINNLMIAINE